MKFPVTLFAVFFSFVALDAQVDLESLAKSEIASYCRMKDYGAKRTSGDNIDIVYAALYLKPNMQTAFLNGNINYHFYTSGLVNQLNFDLRTELTVDSIIFRGQKTTFTHTAGHLLNIVLGLTIPANTLDSLRIYYKGTPDQANRAYSRNVTASGNVIATLSEPYGAHYWWPCRENLSDKIDSLDVRVTVDSIYKVASNGLLQSVTVLDSFSTWHWKHRYPVATYLVAFSASRYTVYSDYAMLKNGKQVEILNYVFPHNETDARIKTQATVPVMQLFDSLFGTYPFYKEKYGHAQFTAGGGMEHQTMSFVGNFGYDLIAHELAHQWFGDKITCGTWHDLWLNESFATYCNLLCYDFLKPESEWLSQLKKFKSDVLSQTGGSVRATDTANVGPLFEYRTTYQKGALVLHQLRWLIGDKAFFDGLRNYMASNNLAYGFAKSNDLKFYLEQSSGKNLTDYFNDCITGEGYPVYNIKWQQKGAEVSIDIIQTQSHPSVELYNVPLPLLLKGNGVDTLVIVPVSKGIENFLINLPFKVKEMAFDPDEWILGKNNIQFINGLSKEVFTIYPNPSMNQLHISLDNMDLTGWQIMDAAGRVVMTKKNETNIAKGSIETIDVKSLAGGIYTIRLQSTESTYTKKIILN